MYLRVYASHGDTAFGAYTSNEFLRDTWVFELGNSAAFKRKRKTQLLKDEYKRIHQALTHHWWYLKEPQNIAILRTNDRNCKANGNCVLVKIALGGYRNTEEDFSFDCCNEVNKNSFVWCFASCTFIFFLGLIQ